MICCPPAMWCEYGRARPLFKIGAPTGSIALRPQIGLAVNRLADVMVQSAVERVALDEEYCGEIIGRIDPEQSRPGAVPEELADRAAIFGRILGPAGADEDIDPPAAAALARKPRPLGHAGVELVGGHEPDGRRFEDAHAIEAAAVEQHAGESQIIVEGRGEPGAAHGQLARAEVEAADLGLGLAL